MSIYSTKITNACQEQSNNKSKTVLVLLLIQNSVLDKKISSFCRDVFIRLLTHLNHKTGLCNPSEKMLAEAFGVCEKTVARAIKKLKDAEWLYVEHRYKDSNIYTFNWSKAVTLDLKNKHSGRTNMSCQNDVLDGQMVTSGRTNGDLWTDISRHSGRTNMSDKLIEGNLLNQLIELNLGDVEKTEENKESTFFHKKLVSPPPPTFISHNNSAKQADAGEPVKTFISHNEKAAAAGNGGEREPDQADAAADQRFQQFWNAYQPPASQDKYRPGIRAAFIQKLKDGVSADKIINAATDAAATGINETTLPLQWLRSEMWKIAPTPSIYEELEIENSRNARREQLDNERKEVLLKFNGHGDDDDEEERRRIEQLWGVVNNLLSDNTPLRAHSAQWVVDHQQHIDELCSAYPDELLGTLARRFAQLKTLGTVHLEGDVEENEQ